MKSKSCPFCGEEPEYTTQSNGHIVKCGDCHCPAGMSMGGVYKGWTSKKLAFESWNRRVNK